MAAPCFSITGLNFSRSLACSVGENSVTVMPAFLSWSSWPAAASRLVWRWKRLASTAASCRIFWSAGASVSQTFLLTISDCGLYWWLVTARNFCTSKNLLARITLKGFSCPSMAFCSRPA